MGNFAKISRSLCKFYGNNMFFHHINDIEFQVMFTRPRHCCSEDRQKCSGRKWPLLNLPRGHTTTNYDT